MTHERAQQEGVQGQMLGQLRAAGSAGVVRPQGQEPGLKKANMSKGTEMGWDLHLGSSTGLAGRAWPVLLL